MNIGIVKTGYDHFLSGTTLCSSPYIFIFSYCGLLSDTFSIMLNGVGWRKDMNLETSKEAIVA
jgi:hypothetical protein